MKPIQIFENSAILEPLSRAAQEGTLASCYLLEGPAGTGKRTIALYLAALIACEHPVDGKPCFACRACENVYAGAHPDVMTVVPEEKKTQIGVEAVRAVNSASLTAPIHARLRVFLIPDAEKLTVGAQNALLKNLEEPRGSFVYFLMTPEAGTLLPTVRSRAVKYHTELLGEATVAEALKVQFPKAEPERIALAAKLCGGSLGTAQSFLKSRKLPQLRETVIQYLGLMAQKAPYAAYLSLIPPDTKREDVKLLYPLLFCAVRDALCTLCGGEQTLFFESAAEVPAFSPGDEPALCALCEQLCALLDPRMQSANAAASLFALHAAAAGNIGGEMRGAPKTGLPIY